MASPVLCFGDGNWLSFWQGLEWPIDILITLVWVAYGIVFFGTVAQRKTRHIYVANWFFSAFIIAVAILHVVNSLAVPVTLTKSYSVYAGTVDAMVQWWYGHNAVGFFLTAGFLGMMYYFVPKQAGRPVYSYRLSVVPLCLGRPASPALYDAARLGAESWHGHVFSPAGAFMGRHD